MGEIRSLTCENQLRWISQTADGKRRCCRVSHHLSFLICALVRSQKPTSEEFQFPLRTFVLPEPLAEFCPLFPNPAGFWHVFYIEETAGAPPKLSVSGKLPAALHRWPCRTARAQKNSSKTCLWNVYTAQSMHVDKFPESHRPKTWEKPKASRKPVM